MPDSADQILTAAQMRGAEQALIAGGTSVDELMRRAGRGAAEWVWRLSAGRPVTVLCGPGNNGGDGYVIAEAIRRRGGKIVVVAAADPATAAARNARAACKGQVLDAAADPHGDVLVDCLFGTGLKRPLAAADHGLLTRLAARHPHRIAIDLPSGIDADSGQPLGAGLPDYALTLALGAWKFAHLLMPACAAMGALRLVEIGVGPQPDVARMLRRPLLSAPPADAHKYRRGLLAVVGGAMPGAAQLAARAAQGAGAGYIKLLADGALAAASDLVVDSQPLADALGDGRIAALLVGPGLGRDATARQRLTAALAHGLPTVLDADALVLLNPAMIEGHNAPLIATPHDGEVLALERAFGCLGSGSKVERARELAQASGMIVVAKGADTVIAAPDGRVVCAPRASSWLSVAGTGDVLAGTIASRLANGADAFTAAAQGVWLHGEAARQAGVAFSAGQLADRVRSAYAAAR